MLAVSQSRVNPGKDDNAKSDTKYELSSDTTFDVDNFNITADEFPEFADNANYLLESFDFDDLFSGIGEGEELPDLEVDPEELLFAEFRSEESSDLNGSSVTVEVNNKPKDQANDKNNTSVDSRDTNKEEVVSKRVFKDDHESKKNRRKKKKKGKSSEGKNDTEKDGQVDPNQGKRKLKVDWTPDLHRRFVQAVEQLGVDKAVPSRILELMGVDTLTRHNVASHLQKYRSHRKHMLAREAEAASWSRKRQVYNTGVEGKGPWFGAPTLGIPPPINPTHHHHQPPFRPLHVWGHPPFDQSLLHVWPKHIPHSSPPPPRPHIWPPPPPHPPLDTGFWHRQVTGGVRPGTPCFAHVPLLPSTRFGAPTVPGIPPHSGIGFPAPHLRPPLELHPTKESLDEAIGEVLAKPWLPLSLGLKPPSTDSVMAELQRQGISNVPPSDG